MLPIRPDKGRRMSPGNPTYLRLPLSLVSGLLLLPAILVPLVLGQMFPQGPGWFAAEAGVAAALLPGLADAVAGSGTELRGPQESRVALVARHAGVLRAHPDGPIGRIRIEAQREDAVAG